MRKILVAGAHKTGKRKKKGTKPHKMGIISPIKKKCTVFRCKNYCAKNSSFCEKHKKQKYRGKVLTLKKGEEFKAVGRPLLGLDDVEFPKKKLGREKKLLERRIPLDLICHEIWEPEQNPDAPLDKQLVDNLASFLQEIPHNSGIRESIVNGICSGIGHNALVRRLSIGDGTVQRAKKMETNHLVKITYRITPSVERIDSQLKKRVQMWMLDMTVPKSGDKRTVSIPMGNGIKEIRARHSLKATKISFYMQYVAEWYLTGQEDDIVSFSTFKRWIPKEIRKEKWNAADDKVDECPHCAEHNTKMDALKVELNLLEKDKAKLQGQLTRAKKQELAAIEDRIKEIQVLLNEKSEHIETSHIQRGAFRNLKANFDIETLIVVQDFTKHYGKVFF
jgi:hypothetical protein